MSDFGDVDRTPSGQVDVTPPKSGIVAVYSFEGEFTGFVTPGFDDRHVLCGEQLSEHEWVVAENGVHRACDIQKKRLEAQP